MDTLRSGLNLPFSQFQKIVIEVVKDEKFKVKDITYVIELLSLEQKTFVLQIVAGLKANEEICKELLEEVKSLAHLLDLLGVLIKDLNEIGFLDGFIKSILKELNESEDQRLLLRIIGFIQILILYFEKDLVNLLLTAMQRKVFKKAQFLRVAVINVLGEVARKHPTSQSRIVPALLAVKEDSPSKFVDHSLTVQLASLLGVASAEKYHTLLMEAIGKKKRTEIDDDEEDLRRVKKQKPLGSYAWQEPSRLDRVDITTFGLKAVCEAVVKTLANARLEGLAEALEAWRPTQSALARRDPRRQKAPAEVVASDQKLPEPKKELPFDQLRAAQLVPTGDDAVIQVLDMIIQRAQMGTFAEAVTLAKFDAALQSFGLDHIESTLIPRIFGDLANNLGFLLTWLRVKWLGGSGYENLLERVFGRVGVYVEQVEADSSLRWENTVNNLLSELPSLTPTAAVNLMRSLLSVSNRAESVLFLIESLIAERPSLKSVLLGIVLEMVLSSENGAVSKSAITTAVRVGGGAVERGALEGLELLINQEEGNFYLMDLAVAYAHAHPEFTRQILQYWSDLGDEARAYLNSKLGDVPIEDAAELLGETTEDDLASLLVLKIDFTDSQSSALCHQIERGSYGLLTISSFAKVAKNSEHLKLLIPRLVSLLTDSTVDAVSKCFVDFVRIISPIDLFIYLHKLDGLVELRKQVESINICFRNLQFDVKILGAALQQMIDHSPFPLLFMRSVYQSLTLYKSMSGFILGTTYIYHNRRSTS